MTQPAALAPLTPFGPARVEAMIAAAGLAAPVAFFQALLIRGWFALVGPR